jgi:dUTP pyrophosphatase
MQVLIKKLHPNAVIPSYAKAGDAGMDMVAISATISEDGLYIEYGTGIAVEIPHGYVGLIFARSSISKTSLILANHVGVVDSGYRGEIKFRFKDTEMQYTYAYPGIKKSYFCGETAYEAGDKIGQLVIVPYPQIEWSETDELSDSNRGAGGFGSTGK